MRVSNAPIAMGQEAAHFSFGGWRERALRYPKVREGRRVSTQAIQRGRKGFLGLFGENRSIYAFRRVTRLHGENSNG